MPEACKFTRSITRAHVEVFLAETESISGKSGDTMNLSKRAIAEFFGTFWLVFGGLRLAPSSLQASTSESDTSVWPRLRTHCSHHGLRHWPRLRLAISTLLSPSDSSRPNASQMSELPAYIIAQVLGAISPLQEFSTSSPAATQASPLAGGFTSIALRADHSPEHYIDDRLPASSSRSSSPHSLPSRHSWRN